jgi:hypothetical protein
VQTLNTNDKNRNITPSQFSHIVRKKNYFQLLSFQYFKYV